MIKDKNVITVNEFVKKGIGKTDKKTRDVEKVFQDWCRQQPLKVIAQDQTVQKYYIVGDIPQGLLLYYKSRDGESKQVTQCRDTEKYFQDNGILKFRNVGDETKEDIIEFSSLNSRLGENGYLYYLNDQDEEVKIIFIYKLQEEDNLSEKGMQSQFATIWEQMGFSKLTQEFFLSYADQSGFLCNSFYCLSEYLLEYKSIKEFFIKNPISNDLIFRLGEDGNIIFENKFVAFLSDSNDPEEAVGKIKLHTQVAIRTEGYEESESKEATEARFTDAEVLEFCPANEDEIGDNLAFRIFNYDKTITIFVREVQSNKYRKEINKYEEKVKNLKKRKGIYEIYDKTIKEFEYKIRAYNLAIHSLEILNHLERLIPDFETVKEKIEFAELISEFEEELQKEVKDVDSKINDLCFYIKSYEKSINDSLKHVISGKCVNAGYEIMKMEACVSTVNTLSALFASDLELYHLKKGCNKITEDSLKEMITEHGLKAQKHKELRYTECNDIIKKIALGRFSRKNLDDFINRNVEFIANISFEAQDIGYESHKSSVHESSSVKYEADLYLVQERGASNKEWKSVESPTDAKVSTTYICVDRNDDSMYIALELAKKKGKIYAFASFFSAISIIASTASYVYLFHTIELAFYSLKHNPISKEAGVTSLVLFSFIVSLIVFLICLMQFIKYYDKVKLLNMNINKANKISHDQVNKQTAIDDNEKTNTTTVIAKAEVITHKVQSDGKLFSKAE